ncbi:MAG: hypothetical protein B6D62_00565 [Candidatus Cloacimonas sp. 4484_275]|nr:MAG: hypothetical protein B6D62_00565 [Candidatus Cloacimonas sp. 4484_275]
MPIPILKSWGKYFSNYDEGLGSSYERIVLNKKLEAVCKHFRVKRVLEAPIFGFTGVSGINSVYLAKKGCEISLVDHDKKRLEMINSVWEKIGLPVKTFFSENYNKLPFSDNEFDLSWNFSAIWFAENLEKFLSELSRVTSKVIFISVPNRNGLGYHALKFLEKEEMKKYLKEENIIPGNIIKILAEKGWDLLIKDYIDCPPWPDIGMPKKKFLKIFGLDWLIKEKVQAPVSIMDYYLGKDENFPEKMMRYYWLEKHAPNFVKMFWSHHKYLLFIPRKEK